MLAPHAPRPNLAALEGGEGPRAYDPAPPDAGEALKCILSQSLRGETDPSTRGFYSGKTCRRCTTCRNESVSAEAVGSVALGCVAGATTDQGGTRMSHVAS